MTDVLHAPAPSRDRFGTATSLEDLSPRELEVLTLIVRGCSNEEIGRELYVTINTVKTFIRSAYRKMGVTTRTQAVVWGATHGLLDLPAPTLRA